MPTRDVVCAVTLGVAMEFHRVPDTGVFTQLGADGLSLAAFLPVLIAVMLGAEREYTVLAAISAAFTMSFLT